MKYWETRVRLETRQGREHNYAGIHQGIQAHTAAKTALRCVEKGIPKGSQIVKIEITLILRPGMDWTEYCQQRRLQTLTSAQLRSRS